MCTFDWVLTTIWWFRRKANRDYTLKIQYRSIVANIYFFGALAASLLAVAVYFDRIASKRLKSMVALTLKGTGEVWNGTDAQFISMYIRNTISRVYGSETITIKNILVSSFISAVAFSIVLIVSCIRSNVNIMNSFDNWSITPLSSSLTVLYFIICVLFIDSLSFVQTALFMNISSKLKHSREIYFMIFADIILSLNLFVFIFPL
jgi:hypothetical protein